MTIIYRFPWSSNGLGLFCPLRSQQFLYLLQLLLQQHPAGPASIMPLSHSAFHQLHLKITDHSKINGASLLCKHIQALKFHSWIFHTAEQLKQSWNNFGWPTCSLPNNSGLVWELPWDKNHSQQATSTYPLGPWGEESFMLRMWVISFQLASVS